MPGANKHNLSGEPTTIEHASSPQVFATTRARKRASVACRSCHERKVRCNVSQVGPPCLNCRHDNVSCQIAPRKRQKSTRPQHLPGLLNSRKLSVTDGLLTRLRTKSDTPPLVSLEGNIITPHVPVDSVEVQNSTETPLREEAPPDSEPRIPSSAANPDRDEGENCGAYATALTGNFEGKESVPFYVGDQQGFDFVSDICQADDAPKATHYLVPKVIAKSLTAEDLAFIRLKGAFSLPNDEVCQELIRCYFHYVHPFLPIIEAPDFIERYRKGAAKSVNLLLLWSIFFAAANFVDKDTLQKSGYASRKAMKRALYRRAKVLYDFDYEMDKIVLIQSVILLGFWYPDTEDRTGSWHWIGIAISLCQTIGLHRDPKNPVKSRTGGGSEFQNRIWRRIWWSCHSREAWLSLGMGRPMRINIEDCDTRLPSPEDFRADWSTVSASTKKAYFPENEDALAHSWVNMTKLHVVLAHVLATHYRPRDIKPTVAEIENCFKDIVSCSDSSQNSLESEFPVAALVSRQLQLHYNATIITLYRPYILRLPGDLTDATQEQQAEWRDYALQKARTAANASNAVTNQLIASHMIQLCPSMTVTAIMPAMQIHLLEHRSESFLARKLGEHQLNMCMLIMGELQETYWAASFVIKLFSEARDRQVLMNSQRPVLESKDSTNVFHRDDGKQNSQQTLTMQYIDEDALLSDSFLADRWNPYAILPEINQNSTDMWPNMFPNSLVGSDDFDSFSQNII